MGNNRYSEKEIAIFNGLIELIKNGANPYSIKVSDIAKASNVGKGTIYDYFSSKEEAISKAILYSINKEIECACRRIREKEKFKEKFYEILYIMAESLENHKSTFSMLLAAGGIQEFYEYLVDGEYDFSDIFNVASNIIEHILQAGYKEGIVGVAESLYYKKMVVQSAVAGFSVYLNNKKNWYADTTVEEAMNSSYKMLIKALK